MDTFKNIPLTKQIDLLPYVDKEVIDLWLHDNPKIILIHDNKLPETLKIKNENGYYSLQSLKKFNKDDIICKNEILYIEHDSIIIMNVNNKYILMENIMHSVNNINNRFFYYFDSFGEHSCDPNHELINTSDTEYNLVALKNIDIGDILTSDYTLYDHNNDAPKFECNCKSTNCKIYI
jgi:hypothetical protein